MPNSAMGTPPFVISKFDKALHDRSAFSCGFDPIDKFLKEGLSDHIKTGYVVAYMAVSEGQNDVVGFYTLNAFAVREDHIETPKRPRPPPTIPATYIKAVAVRDDMQGQGLGKALMIHAMRQALSIADKMGSAAIVLDVLRDTQFDRRLAFYENLGFHPLNDPESPDRLYIGMNDVRATFTV